MKAAWLDAEGAAGTVVCEVRAGCCLQMSPSAYWLFTNLRDGRTPEQIADLAERSFGQSVDVALLGRACDEILVKVEEETRLADARRRRRYLFRIRILPESAVGWLASRLSWLQDRRMLVPYAALIVAAAIAQAVSDGPAQTLRHINAGDGILTAYLIYLLALVAHEFGHATACTRYGVKPGSVGFAVYLAFPALYCDVTGAWLLPRRQRVVVDISGVAYEIGAGALFAVIGGALHQWAFTLAAFLVLGNLAWALNPFGRFDMYWTLTDALGATNLSAEGWRVLRGLFRRGSDETARAVSRWRAVVVAGYGTCSLLMFGLFFYYAIVIDIPLIGRLPQIGRATGADVASGHVVAALGSVLGPLTMLAMLGFMTFRLGAGGMRAAAGRLRKTSQELRCQAATED